MASACRSALMAGSRSMATRSRIVTQRTLNSSASSSPLSSSSSRTFRYASRFGPVLGTMDSLMPLHSAIASARLKSRIAVDTSCWSLLSQGFATPL